MSPDKAEGFGAEDFARLARVSRETLGHLQMYALMLAEWNARYNLVSAASTADLWRRHFWDSAQIALYFPHRAKSLVDLGSGAGFPGLVLAELMRDRPDFHIVLYEATAKKCRFLQEVVTELELDCEIRQARIEDSVREPFDLITARACAPLEKLLPYAHRFWTKGTTALFLKGQNVDAELTQAHKSWRMVLERYPSQSDVSGVVLEIRELHRVADERKHTRP